MLRPVRLLTFRRSSFVLMFVDVLFLFAVLNIISTLKKHKLKNKTCLCCLCTASGSVSEQTSFSSPQLPIIKQSNVDILVADGHAFWIPILISFCIEVWTINPSESLYQVIGDYKPYNSTTITTTTTTTKPPPFPLSTNHHHRKTPTKSQHQHHIIYLHRNPI